MQQPRYLFVEGARVLRQDGEDYVEGWLLIEESNGAWRSPTGPELMALHRLHPNFIRSTQRPKSDEQ